MSVHYGRCFKLTNQHVWDEENSHAQHAHGFQQRHGFTVWAGIVHSCLIGPCRHPPCLTCHTYFLQNVLDELLKDVSLDIRQSLRFQDDGALPQVIGSVPGHLYRCFVQRWIGRGDPITRPPWSPDLSLNFFVWGHMKTGVTGPTGQWERSTCTSSVRCTRDSTDNWCNVTSVLDYESQV